MLDCLVTDGVVKSGTGTVHGITVAIGQMMQLVSFEASLCCKIEEAQGRGIVCLGFLFLSKPIVLPSSTKPFSLSLSLLLH